MIYLLLLCNILFLVTGQFLWKIAVSGINNWSASTFISLIWNPYFLGGGLLYVLATGLWVMILSKLPLHIAYPMQSLCYILAALLSYFVFKENITIQQWMGMMAIMFGVYLISR
jgi:drug/metabolite transporter (DMT)-like permease